MVSAIPRWARLGEGARSAALVAPRADDDAEPIDVDGRGSRDEPP